jgi:hypothetical protein
MGGDLIKIRFEKQLKMLCDDVEKQDGFIIINKLTNEVHCWLLDTVLFNKIISIIIDNSEQYPKWI